MTLTGDTMSSVARVAAAGAARRRRERRYRSFWRHELMAVKMATLTACHHSAQKKPAVTHAATQADLTHGEVTSAPAVTYAAPAPVFGFVAPSPAVTDAAPTPVVGCVAPTPAVTYEAPAPVVGFDAPAPAVTYAAPAPVFEYVTPAPVLGFIAPAPAGSFVAPSQQLRPAYTDDAAVVVSASQVVGSLPHGKVFAAPVFHQVHHVPLAEGGIPENLVEIPVVVARRPPPLVDVRPSSCAQRHIMEDLGELAPSVQLLDLPVPQMVENVTDTLLRILDFPIAEQVIAVPTVSCASCPSRSRVPEPQSADQLVEVPTVLTPTRIALQIAEQIVDTPVPRAHDHGSLPGQSSSSRRERCPRSGCCFAWGRTVCGTGCRRCSPCVTSSERIAGAWVFRSHRSASTVMGSSRLNSLQLSLGLKMATSSMLRRCLRRKRRRRKTTTTTTSSMGRCLVFLRGSYLYGCAGGSLPGTAGKGGGVCLLTL